ncbi:unnamed protein product [Linum tenue]|uniref:Uncharacterized protein n=1 Tax=Linum tenue TaxID=586396 RepID=A0AAV0P0J9_9ROSI|nr:unnamed protein product [Linum tenue]
MLKFQNWILKIQFRKLEQEELSYVA